MDAEVYGKYQTGVFTGVANGGTNTNPCRFTSCYASGFIEGIEQLGGFIGNIFKNGSLYAFNIKNCYSTALVGIRSDGIALGGFVGYVGVTAFNAILTMDSCYAAGEVGSIDTLLQTMNGTVYDKFGNATVYNATYQPQLSGGMFGAVSLGFQVGETGFCAVNW